MRKGQFVEYIESASYINSTEIEEMLAMAEQFPYSAALQKVVLRFLHFDGDVRYDERLPLVAAVVRDRKKLYYYLNEDNYKRNQIIAAESDLGDSQVFKSDGDKEKVDQAPSRRTEYFEDISYSTEVFSLVGYNLGDRSEDADGGKARTFSDWLKYMENHKNDDVKESAEGSVESDDKWSLIDSFIKEQPEIKPSRSKDQSKVVRNEIEYSNQDSEDFITETLAQIYIKQKHYDKAIKIFEKLSLKYPEKNTYFAGQIKLIGQLKNNEKDE